MYHVGMRKDALSPCDVCVLGNMFPWFLYVLYTTLLAVGVKPNTQHGFFLTTTSPELRSGVLWKVCIARRWIICHLLRIVVRVGERLRMMIEVTGSVSRSEQDCVCMSCVMRQVIPRRSLSIRHIVFLARSINMRQSRYFRKLFCIVVAFCT